MGELKEAYLRKHFSDVELRAELLRRETVRKEEEAKERPKPIYPLSPGHCLYGLFEACERYIDAVGNDDIFTDHSHRQRQIGTTALKGIYGDKVLEWIDSQGP